MKKLSEEHKANIAKAKRGKPRDAHTKAKISKGVAKYIEEHGHNMQGKKHRPDTIEKMRRPKSIETRQKMSQTRLERYGVPERYNEDDTIEAVFHDDWYDNVEEREVIDGDLWE